MSTRKWLLLGLGLSAILLAAILWRLDWSVFTGEIRRLRFVWLAAAIVLIATGIALRSLRWNLVAGMPLATYRLFWTATTIGLMINHLYPLRAGEVFRVFAIRRLAQIPLGRATTSAVIDRLADVLLLGISAVMVVAAHSGLPYAERLAAVTLASGLAALCALAAFIRGASLLRRWIASWGARISNLMQDRVERFYSEALATAAVIGSPLRLMGIIAFTGVIFAFDFAVMFCALKAFGWNMPVMAAVTILVFLAIGTSLPAAPGYAGTYQMACVLALAIFDVGESQAVAYSIVLQGCVLFTVIVLSGCAAIGHIEDFKSGRGALTGLK